MEWVAEFGVGAFWRHNEAAILLAVMRSTDGAGESCEDLQESDAGRSFLAALHSTWILQVRSLSVIYSCRCLPFSPAGQPVTHTQPALVGGAQPQVGKH